MGISLNGEIVVNLWGGHKDKDLDSHWEEDTIINVWSSTKNMASLGYTPLRMEDDVFGEERTNNIVKAFVECID